MRLGFIAVIAVFTALQPVAAGAQQQQAPASAAPSAAPRVFTTSHRFEAAAESFAYTASVRRYPLADGSGQTKADIWATSYVRADAGQPARPVTFVFNGGPGASSAYLHMGGLGPRRVDTPPDGGIPTLPANVVDNAQSWLAFTDLVFFDPVGTGWSRPAQVDGKPVPTAEFWSPEADVAWTARFVRDWLTIHQRWGSPVLIAGESYGGFRAARLAAFLPQQFALPVAGVVLISPYLEAALSRGDERLNPLIPALRLPTLAAIAWHHGRSGASGARDDAARDVFLADVERFALADYLPTLAMGAAADETARQRVFARLADATGLPLDMVSHADGRISREFFVKHGLPGQVLGRYDGALAVADAAPASPQADDPDPSTALFGPVLAAAVNMQLRETLHARHDAPYVLLNSETAQRWNWGRRDGSASQLRTGMLANPALKVLVVHGRFDMVTPYFVTTHVVRQLQLPEAQRSNVAFALLDGGHMMYFHARSRQLLLEAARDFYTRVAPSTR